MLVLFPPGENALLVNEFSCVILGDEPAGLWLAGRLDRLTSGRAIFGWVSLQENLSRVPIPTKIAPLFEIPLAETWSAEIVHPHRNFTWSDKSLAERFPQLPLIPPAADLLPRLPKLLSQPPGQNLSALRRALHYYPELLTLACAIWKGLGRTERLHPETLLLSALYCTELCWWEPWAQLPAGVTQFRHDPEENQIEEIKPLRHGGVSIKFKNNHPIVSRRWIINTKPSDLVRLCGADPELLKFFHIPEAMHSATSRYRLQFLVDKASVPTPVGPLTVWLDTENIPDLENEIWPLFLERGDSADVLEMWVSGFRETNLESLESAFRQAYKRLNRLLPFLHRSVSDISPPLDTSNCFSDVQRLANFALLQKHRVETYHSTSFRTDTSNPAVSNLFPFLNCHLPYPIGPLETARKLVTELVGKKKLRAHEEMMSADPPF